jgi:hypothetical protein
VRWRWPWRRRQVRYGRRARHGGWEPYGRIPDYDTVFPPGNHRYSPHWADLTHTTPADPVLDEPTAAYRTVRVPPWV